MKTALFKAKKTPPAAKSLGLEDRSMEALVDVFKSLADKHRLLILMILARAGELHVSRICEEIGQSQPAVSHHLTQLKNAHLVAVRREGKFNFYYLDSETLSELLEKFFPGSGNKKFSFADMELSFRSR